MKRLHRKEGFTLIELMIVILIIAILVAIAVPVYLSARSNAQKRTCQANLRTIDGAINTYIADQTGDAEAVYPLVMTDMVGKVLKAEPFCPAGTTVTKIYAFKLPGSAGMSASCISGVAGHSYP